MFSVHLGLDDTDSEEGMCTTYLITIILQKLLKEEIIKYEEEEIFGNLFDKTVIEGEILTEVKTNDIDVMDDGGDSEATLRQIYDMLKAYFEGGEAGAAPAGDMGDMGDMDMDMDMDTDMALM